MVRFNTQLPRELPSQPHVMGMSLVNEMEVEGTGRKSVKWEDEDGEGEWKSSD